MSRFLRTSYAVASIGGVAFFVLSVTLLGIWPRRVLNEQSQRMAPEHPLLLTAAEQRGRDVYSREGCAYCHTQQVRYVESDTARFGAPTLAWETRWDYPHLWGTRRIGPDLARQSATHPADWHFAHLYAPRSVAADSVMPAYTWLFQGSVDQPTQEARDLVAYLDTLGRAREIAAPEGEARAQAACNCDEMGQMAFHTASINTSAAKPRRAGNTPSLPPASGAGRELYARYCASCHGAQGAGDGPAASALHPRPASFADHEYSLERLSFVLENGVAGTSMSAWRDLSLPDRSALAATVQQMHAPQTEPAIPRPTLELGARVYRANCAQCHGESGAGDGFAVPELRIVPANLQGVRPTIAQSLKVLREGVEGTQMAPWTGRLSAAELSAVAYYVRGFFRGAAR